MRAPETRILVMRSLLARDVVGGGMCGLGRFRVAEWKELWKGEEIGIFLDWGVFLEDRGIRPVQASGAWSRLES